MRILLLISLLALASCSSVGDPPAPLTRWADFDAAILELPDPVPVPPSVPAQVGQIGGEDVVYYTLPQAERLELRLEALNTNSALAAEAIPAARQLDASSRALLDAGRLTEERANWLAAREHEARAEAYQARKEHLMDNLLHRAVFLILLGFGL